MSSVFRSEHRSRYKEEPHIRVLAWDKEAIRYFLREKIRRLDTKYFVGNHNDKTFQGWLGIESVHNNVRNIQESVEEYLLRHTRLLPRDIVILGNALCKEIDRARSLSLPIASDVMVREAVSDVAKFLGNEQLTICGNWIAANLVPEHAAKQRYSEVYTGDKEYIRGITEDLKKVIQWVGKDRFSRDEMADADEYATTLFLPRQDVFSVLWQNGLVAYIDPAASTERVVFYSDVLMDDFNVPLDKESYAFHPCLIDALGVKPVGEVPVCY